MSFYAGLMSLFGRYEIRQEKKKVKTEKLEWNGWKVIVF